MHAIEIEGLRKQFKGKKKTIVNALMGIDLKIGTGEIFGFLGPNGAGKSTTIKCLMGLIRPTTGTATIMGHSIDSELSRAKVGFLPENPSFYDYLSAEEYLRFVGKVFKMHDNLLLRRIDETLSLMGLQEARKRPMRGYSKGMVQRVGLAQTLIHDPDVYILDEPMSGLDPIGRALFKDIILDLKKRGKSVFFSTHITDDVEKVCDRVGVIVKGELMALDAVDNILRSGIEGYVVQVRHNEEYRKFQDVFIQLRSKNSLYEYLVPVNQLSEFTASAVKSGIEILLIETKRRDLESFFLDIVNKTTRKADT